MEKEWEIRFKLKVENRSEDFKFLVTPLEETGSEIEFPSFPKDKFIRALRAHSDSNEYVLHRAKITELQFRKTKLYKPDQEFHIIMVVFEKIGPVSLVFTNKFEYLVLEGIDSNYSYLGVETIINMLLQVIKPDSPEVKGVGKIKTIYHASNYEILEKTATMTPILDTLEGQALFFGLSIILPTLFTIVLPPDFLSTTYSYLFALAVYLILACLFPIVKRSTRYAPLSLISLLASYLIIETLIHIRMLEAINPWGIFNNISRQNLIGILKSQEVVQAAVNPPLFMGIDFLGVLVPFLDIIILSIVPFTVAVSLAGLIENFDWSLKKRFIVKVFFVVLFTLSIITIPLTYHALAKGSEGTLQASIGLTEAIEIFDPKYMEDLENNYQELLGLIDSARWHLLKSSNSFMQFSQNPLIAYLLPYFIPNVSGIPLEDLPGILNITSALGNSLTYFPNILWSISNFQEGFNLTLDILQDTMSNINSSGVAASVMQNYNVTMREALSVINRGLNNLSYAQGPLLELISQIHSSLNYSIFGEITAFLQEMEIALPVLTTVIANFVPWINSTYKLSLALQDLYENSNFHSDLLDDAKKEFNSTRELLSIELENLPPKSEENFIPIHDLVTFSINLYNISQYYVYSVDNASLMFQELNSTLSIVQSLDLSNSSNIEDPKWSAISEGLDNTGDFLNHTESSLIEMQNIIDSQENTQLDFEQLDQLNTFFAGL
ncbi:MAG: hypothetical protein ACTSW1_03910, partial [Candidatus Hodarchaeales archaeon]